MIGGARGYQIIPATREIAFEESDKARRALVKAKAEGAGSSRLERLQAAYWDASAMWQQWVQADSFAAQAGCYD